MKSIALGYTLKDQPEKENENLNQNDVTAEFHINYWKLSKRGILRNKVRFADLGLLISGDTHNIEKICVYFPFKVYKKELSDLGECIATDNKLLRTLFNAECFLNNAKPPFYCISNSEDTEGGFYIYELGTENFEIEECEGEKGTMVIIKILSHFNNIKEYKKMYIRFRVYSKALKKFNYVEKLSNDIIQSAFSRTELIDFRVNDIRELDNKILEVFKLKHNLFSFSKIYFFFVGNTKEEIIQTSPEVESCRIMEEDHWARYLEDIKYKRRKVILSHRWMSVPESGEKLKSFSFLLKTVYSRISFPNAIVYLLVLLICGIIASYIASYIEDYLGR